MALKISFLRGLQLLLWRDESPEAVFLSVSDGLFSVGLGSTLGLWTGEECVRACVYERMK